MIPSFNNQEPGNTSSWSAFEDQEHEQKLFLSNSQKAQESDIAALCLDVLYNNFDEQKFELNFKSNLAKLFNEKTIIYFKEQPLTQFQEVLIFSTPENLLKILRLIVQWDKNLATTQIAYFLPFFLTQTQSEDFLENISLFIEHFPEIELADGNTFGHLIFIQQLPDGFRKHFFDTWIQKVSANFLQKRNIFGRSIMRSIIEKINDDEFSFDISNKKDELLECLNILLNNIDDVYEQIIDKPLLKEIIHDNQLRSLIEAKIESKSIALSIDQKINQSTKTQNNHSYIKEKEAKRL